ncbi:hypothetical protein PFMALIP_00368 [Plasmodium falciparum MaliPS096_E11]|uniref:Uncharacterized protein n=1 Tax=Plasmodium falciparum MaliPS096_E11 TaxID=1036727 RepID=A0A024WY74_PLAFA|nr:hypothetical protein PFMALIP_00368 [Plasmodium falciparum MaliPS096_E11]
MVPNLILKRTLNEMLMYNNKSQLNVSHINNYNHDYENSEISLNQTVLLKTSKKESSNNSENTNNYNIIKREETLEDLLNEYDEEMKEIKNNNKKTFFKRAKLVLEAIDNIFIDKVIDSNIQDRKSGLKEDIIDNAVILCGSMIFTIPIFSYLLKRINFFRLPK